MATAGPAVGVLPVANFAIDYDEELGKIEEFLTTYTTPPRGTRRRHIPADDDAAAEDEDEDDEDEEDADEQDEDDLVDGMDGMDVQDRNHKAKYVKLFKKVANRQTSEITINLEDLKHFTNDQGLLHNIMRNTRRYIALFSEVIDRLLPEPDHRLDFTDDVLDVIMEHRRDLNEATLQGERPAESGLFPPELLRRYNVYFKPPKNKSSVLAVRAVKGAHLGKLITVRGIVTRVSEVKPLLLVNAYTCESCGNEIFQEVASKQFTPLVSCPSDACKADRTSGTLYMQTRASRFKPFQEVKIQEMADQVPVGHIPRSMTVHLYGTLTRSVNPGDVVNISGIFLPTPYTGFRAIRAGLLQDTFLEAMHVHQLKKQYHAMEATPEIQEAIQDLLNSGPDLFPRLAASIAPEIYGHEYVKKALLLLLVGGVNKKVGDGMKIRGDINICLMGDPGVAKSQLLKYICKVAPRGVYTTGRGSSGVGLTAAVMRDPVTDEMVLEGGALVLADNGICCIDEFDKMDDSDRTAIHEVMEQQTISISKAGITTTLNARTSILAAANPLYGRYNTKVSPNENINLPAALLSRFDLLFLILDTPNREADERLANHVAYVHMHNEHPPSEFEPIDPTLMRHYIAECRKIRPIVPPSISEYIVGTYVRMRKDQQEKEAEDKGFAYVSARTLLGVLRLSQALARLRMAGEVEQGDVDAALELMEQSKASLYDDVNGRRAGEDQTETSKIYRIIKEVMKDQSDADEMYGETDEEPEEVAMADVRNRVIAKGFTETAFMDTVLEYENMGVLMRTANQTRLRLVG